MRLVVPLMLLLLGACSQSVTQASEPGLCRGLAPLANAHSQALQSPLVPDAVVITGAQLVIGIDKGCGK